MFFKQCITNACGTVAVLHAALNVYTETPAADDSFIATLAQSLKGKTPVERGKLIAANKVIKAIHDSAACVDGKDVSHLFFYITLSSFLHRWLLRCLYSVLIAVMLCSLRKRAAIIIAHSSQLVAICTSWMGEKTRRLFTEVRQEGHSLTTPSPFSKSSWRKVITLMVLICLF